eukprot:Pgem_evm1s15534
MNSLGATYYHYNNKNGNNLNNNNDSNTVEQLVLQSRDALRRKVFNSVLLEICGLTSIEDLI